MLDTIIAYWYYHEMESERKDIAKMCSTAFNTNALYDYSTIDEDKKTYMKNQKELNQCYVIRYNHRYPILYYIIKNLNNKVITPTYPDFEMLNYTRINFIFTKELRSLFKENRGCYVYLFRKYPESLIKYDGAPNITLEQFKEILNRINCKIEEIMNVTQNPIYLIKFSCEK